MRIAAGTVSCDAYGESRIQAINDRLKTYDLLVEQANERKVHLVCLPGGYLRALDENHRNKVAEYLVKTAKKHNIAIAVGIDIGAKLGSKKKKSHKTKAFAVCWSPVDSQSYCWPQRSSTSRDHGMALPQQIQEYREPRSLQVDKGCVEVLVCGELFNPIIRRALVARRSNIAAVIDLAHVSRGLRVAGSMKILARKGITSLCSVHANQRRGVKYRYDPPQTRNSTRDFDNFHMPPQVGPRVEMKIWEV